MEATVFKGGVLLRPKVLRDRDDFLKELKKDIQQSKADVAAGRILGTFDNARDFARAFTAYKKRLKHARRRS